MEYIDYLGNDFYFLISFTQQQHKRDEHMLLHLWIMKLQTESAFSSNPLSHSVGNSGETCNSKVCLYLEISWLTHYS